MIPVAHGRMRHQSIKRRASSYRPLGLLLIGLLLALVVFPSAVMSQDKKLSIEPSNMQPTIQAGRPIPSWWDVTLKGSSLLEGRIEFKLLNEGRLLATFFTEELALTGPQQRIRILLPPVDDSWQIDQLQVSARFHGKNYSQDLGQHILRVAMSQIRAFMTLTAVGRVAPKRSAERDRIMRRLAFESISPGELDEQAKTISAWMDPADFPQEPIAYCAYELVVLFDNEFRSLKKGQLDALGTWVRAGGSLYIEPSGVLEQHHVEFLRDLVQFDARGLLIQADSHGRLQPGTVWEDERLFSVTNGLGRAVIRIDEDRPHEDFSSPRWRQVPAFLWRLHFIQIRQIGQPGYSNVTSLIPKSSLKSRYVEGDPLSMGEQFVDERQSQKKLPIGWLKLKASTSTLELIDQLMPKGVRMVPLWVLGLILGTFVAWIGPVDYFGLGWLKARKFTWLTFPTATLLATAFTVWITNQYMSSAETRRSLVLQDVGDDGSVVRTNRLELLFIPTSRQITSTIRKAIFTAMPPSVSVSEYNQYARTPYNRQYRNVDQNAMADEIPIRLDGRIPTDFTVTQRLSKWTPQLNRIFSIAGSNEDAPIDWNALIAGIDLVAMQGSRQISSEFQARIRAQFGASAMSAWIGHQGHWAHDQNPGWSREIDEHSMTKIPVVNYANPLQGPSEAPLFRWMHQHSVAATSGLFSLASQIGPNGGRDMADLAILDATNPRLGLLIVVVPRGGDFIAYRKLIRRDSANE